MLVAQRVTDPIRIHAGTASPHDAHCCPGCGQPVVLKRGKLRIAHFAHTAQRGCTTYARESQAHLAAKRDFLAAFAARGLRCDVEVEVLSGAGDRRADLVVHSPTGRMVAIELQHSSLTLAAIEARTAAYAAAGVPVLWLPILNLARLANPARVRGFNLVRVARYRAPAWQRWVRGYHLLGPWFYEPKAAMLWRGRFSPVTLWSGEQQVDGTGQANWRPSQPR